MRSLVAVLALNGGNSVERKEICSWIWREGESPVSADGALYTCVSRLRNLLNRSMGGGGELMIDTTPGGYSLTVDRSDVDALRFESSLRRARADQRLGRMGSALHGFEEALGFWSGPALANISPTDPVLAESVSLNEARFGAELDLIGVSLRMGRGLEVLDRVSGLVVKNPFVESVSYLYMTALSQCGRRSEAISHYREVYRSMRAELGSVPSIELQNLHTALLQGRAASDGLDISFGEPAQLRSW
ncbi:BTAD domain-containing putative transcriptional regulator [Streptomyces sp. NPDC058297]|uniref:AfsR/SARP family transcriptional regulator n=1 Tax=Streptomyces sp. NPDC058297 TaxID=3346433 RepID=UPI0036F0838F